MQGESYALLEAHWHDLARQALQRCRPFFTDFLPADDLPALHRIAAQEGVALCALHECDEALQAAERTMVCFAPADFPVEAADFPVGRLTIRFRTADTLEHRQILGAMMHCGVERDTIGDIYIAEGLAQAVVCRRVLPVFLQEITQIGRVGVSVSADEGAVLHPVQDRLSLNGSVASLRADAVVAFVTRLSREKAALLIRQGAVIRRHTPVQSSSMLLEPGDVISVRGYGKYEIAQINGKTRKGRLNITINQYRTGRKSQDTLSPGF